MEKECGEFSAQSPVHPAVNGYLGVTRPLSVPLYHSGPGGTLCAHTTVGWCSTVLLQVLGPASGVCYSTGPEFPELCTGTPVFDWGGVALAAAPYILTLHVCVWRDCTCMYVCLTFLSDSSPAEFEGHYWAEQKQRKLQKQKDNVSLVGVALGARPPATGGGGSKVKLLFITSHATVGFYIVSILTYYLKGVLSVCRSMTLPKE